MPAVWILFALGAAWFAGAGEKQDLAVPQLQEAYLAEQRAIDLAIAETVDEHRFDHRARVDAFRDWLAQNENRLEAQQALAAHLDALDPPKRRTPAAKGSRAAEQSDATESRRPSDRRGSRLSRLSQSERKAVKEVDRLARAIRAIHATEAPAEANEARISELLAKYEDTLAEVNQAWTRLAEIDREAKPPEVLPPPADVADTSSEDETKPAERAYQKLVASTQSKRLKACAAMSRSLGRPLTRIEEHQISEEIFEEMENAISKASEAHTLQIRQEQFENHERRRRNSSPPLNRKDE